MRLVFAAVVVGLLGWTIAMSVLEPVLLDGWFVEQWHASGGGFLDFVRANWTGDVTWGNPRLGQWATYVTYTPWHVVVTPLVVVALFVLLLVHLRGRWPDPARDGRALLVLVALAILAQPQIGPVLFYRPFTANYVVGLVVQLAWLVPYRFALARAPGERFAIARVLGMVVLGAAAGACNEHTGPALLAAAGLACWALARRGRLRVYLIVGVVAFAAGYIAMMLAPAQATRYCGVGQESLVGRLADRGIVGTLAIVLAIPIAGRWMWAAVAAVWLAARTRVPWREAALWVVLGAAISLTLLLSPKQGDRLLFAALAFASIGAACVIELLVEARPRLAFAVTIAAAGVVGFAIARTVPIAIRVADDARARAAQLASARGIVAVAPFREPPSRWFIGDDFHMDAMRHRVAQLHGLAAIDVVGKQTIPYSYEIRYTLAGDGTRTAPVFVPLDQCEARRTFTDELAALRSAHGERLAEAVLAVVPRVPVLDGRPLASSRWHAGQLVAPNARVTNELGTRYITIDRGGLAGDPAVTLVGPGRTQALAPDGGRYPYVPWSPGTYWVIACAEHCYLAATIRHKHVRTER